MDSFNRRENLILDGPKETTDTPLSIIVDEFLNSNFIDVSNIKVAQCYPIGNQGPTSTPT